MHWLKKIKPSKGVCSSWKIENSSIDMKNTPKWVLLFTMRSDMFAGNTYEYDEH